MRKQLYIIGILLGTALHAQTALHNTGNLRVHENGMMGFHTDLINDGLFDENLGLVGFYNDDALDISGMLFPSFFDAEFVTQNGVTLNTTVNMLNNANFVSGDVITPRAQPTVNLNFLDDAFSTGENDMSKVDGYASMNGQQSFTFPVGDMEQLRPLILTSEEVNVITTCAYFFGDPNTPGTFGTSFNQGSKSVDISDVSANEFWRLEGSVPSTVQVSWNERSDVASLTDDATEIVLVGWSKATDRWEILEGPASVGDLNQGFATTDAFIPDNYEVITFGATGIPREFLDLDNYIVTPNGDGINDVLEIPELAQSPNNHMQIFDRNGSKVFDKVNYTNEFDGFATTNNFVISRDKGLPSGVYFYIVSMDDLNLDFQGFLYLAND